MCEWDRRDSSFGMLEAPPSHSVESHLLLITRNREPQRLYIDIYWRQSYGGVWRPARYGTKRSLRQRKEFPVTGDSFWFFESTGKTLQIVLPLQTEPVRFYWSNLRRVVSKGRNDSLHNDDGTAEWTPKWGVWRRKLTTWSRGSGSQETPDTEQNQADQVSIQHRTILEPIWAGPMGRDRSGSMESLLKHMAVPSWDLSICTKCL